MRKPRFLGALAIAGSMVPAVLGQTQSIREFQYNGITCLEETLGTGEYGGGPHKEIYCGDKLSGRLDLYGQIDFDRNMKPVLGSLACLYESQGRMDPSWKHPCTGPQPYGSLMARSSIDRSSPYVRKAVDKFKDLIIKFDQQK